LAVRHRWRRTVTSVFSARMLHRALLFTALVAARGGDRATAAVTQGVVAG